MAGVDMAPLPRVAEATALAMAHPAFVAAAPARQPDV